MTITTSNIPIKPISVGILSWNINTPPSSVKITSPDCVDSMTANLCVSLLTISVALKNSIVAIIPEKTATIKDWTICSLLGRPTDNTPEIDIITQNGGLRSALWVKNCTQITGAITRQCAEPAL